MTECLSKLKISIDLPKLLIANNQQGIYVFFHFLHSGFRLGFAFFTLKGEWNGDDADREYAHFFGSLRDYRSCSCSRTSAHSGSDEYHLGIITQYFLNVFNVFNSSIAAYFRH